jgi:hypothetical protein
VLSFESGGDDDGRDGGGDVEARTNSFNAMLRALEDDR